MTLDSFERSPQVERVDRPVHHFTMTIASLVSAKCFQFRDEHPRRLMLVERLVLSAIPPLHEEQPHGVPRHLFNLDVVVEVAGVDPGLPRRRLAIPRKAVLRLHLGPDDRRSARSLRAQENKVVGRDKASSWREQLRPIPAAQRDVVDGEHGMPTLDEEPAHGALPPLPF